MESRLQGLLIWSFAGALALAAPIGRAQSPDRPAAPERSAPASPGGAAVPSQTDNLPDFNVSGWSIPPVRWGGSTGSTYVFNTDMVDARSLSDTQLVTGRASSFIYAPWFAQVNANAGLSTTSSKHTSAGSTSRANSMTLNYGGNVNLFPMSRFPFSAYFESSDSRAKAVTAGGSDAASAMQYNSLRLGARQFYRPEVGNDTMNASADHSVVTSGSVRSTVNAFQGGYSTRMDDHSLATTARYSSTTGDIAGQGSSLFGASGSHTWQIPEEGLTINNSVSLSRNDLKTLASNGAGLLVNNSQVLQGSSFFNWIPDEDLPLTVSGGVGLLNMTTQTESLQTSLANMNGFINANYRISNNLSASAGASIANTAMTTSGKSSGLNANSPRQLTTSQTAGVSYSGDPLSFGNFSYNWGTGVNVSNQTSSIASGASRMFGGSGYHGLSTMIPLSETSILSLNATQSISLNAASTGIGASNQNTMLNHTAGAVWRTNVGQVSVATVSINASDSYSTGTYSNHLRSFGATGNFQTQLSARASLGASATVSGSQQLTTPLAYTTVTTIPGLGTTTTTLPSTIWNGSGQVFYSHRSPFDISNLVYTASFVANANQTNLRVVTGDPNALSWQVARVFTQQATYRLGRLNFQATASIAQTGDGKKSATVFGSISREIGDF